MKYNIAAGMDISTLNNIIADVYTSIYPKLFKGTIKIGDYGIVSVDYDINVAPTVNFGASAEIKSYIDNLFEPKKQVEIPIFSAIEKAQIIDLVAEISSFSVKDKAPIIDQIAAASFGIVANIKLKINYSNEYPIEVQATLNAIVSIQTCTKEGKNFLTVQIISGTIAMNPPNPILDELLNIAFVPYLIDRLNKKILEPIEIPLLQYEELMVSMPVIVVESPDIVAYSALGITQPNIPAPSSWPSDYVFVATDTYALEAAASVPFPMGPSDNFDWKIISGTVGAQVLAPENVQINNDGSLSASITVDVLAQLSLKTPWIFPNVSFGPRAQACLAATFKTSVNNGAVYIAIQSVPIPTFSFDWGITSWVNYLFFPLRRGLAVALNSILGPLIGNVLKFPPIKVYTIPKISIKLAGKTININLENATTSSKNTMLLVAATVNVS